MGPHTQCSVYLAVQQGCRLAHQHACHLYSTAKPPVKTHILGCRHLRARCLKLQRCLASNIIPFNYLHLFVVVLLVQAMLRVLMAHAQAQLPYCQPGQLAILAWAAAVLGSKDACLWASIDAAVRAPGNTGAPKEWRVSLYQDCWVWLC